MAGSREWERYGREVIGSMTEVLEEAAEEHRPVLLEAADYWLSLGLAIWLGRRTDAERLLALIEPDPSERSELDQDAADFCGEALG